MAAKEKKSTVAKHLKDNQSEKEKLGETTKSKRGRKSLASANEKSSLEQTTPAGGRRKRKLNNVEDGRTSLGQKRPRRSVAEVVDDSKTSPGSQKFKKTHLEKELEDLLENATGRNTPSFPRNKKINEKEEDAESVDAMLPNDDNASVRSLSVLRRKNADDDDVASVKSVRSKKESEEDGSIRLIRPLGGRNPRKKKSVLAVIAVKKKILLGRGRPKKIVEDGKKEEKRKVKVEEKQKRVVNKPLKFQNKIGDQKVKAKKKYKIKKKDEGGDVETPKKKKSSTKARKKDTDEKREYFLTEGGDSLVAREQPKVIKLPRVKTEKKTSEERKKRRESGIHFETTRSPDDSSVMIVHPRLGPKIRGTKRLKPILPKTDDLKKSITNDVLPVLPSTTVGKFNQISSSYFVQSIPNFNLFTANSTIIRNYNAGNFAGDESRMTNKDIIVTPSGIVLSGNRLVPSGNQQVCFNGSNFLADGSNGEYPKDESSSSSSSLIYQNSTSVIQAQPGPTPNTAILLKRPEAMSTSLISTTSGTFLVNPTAKAKVCPSTDTMVSEKALEGDFQENRFRNSNSIPSIPVAKNVSDLIMLKNKSSVETQVSEDQLIPTVVKSKDETPVVLESSLVKNRLAKLERRPRRTLQNVRRIHNCGSELTFSEPEYCEKDDVTLYKTISSERLNKPVRIVEPSPNVLLQLGSEPITISETLAPFETASMLLVTKKEKIEEKFEIEEIKSPKVKGAIDVCRFSKENEEALREFGLDSDFDQGKSEADDFPLQKLNVEELTKKAKIKEEVDNILKEMPIRKLSNIHRKSEPFKRLELKSPLINKNDYLTLSPSKPPTVIDKLLEKNKSLKKAEQEGRYQNAVRNLDSALQYDVVEVRPRRNLRETRMRKYAKTLESRRTNRRLMPSGSLYSRRGSNPEIYSDDYLTVKNVSNENVPLRRVTDDAKFQRRSSIDCNSIQKVIDRRCSLPTPSDTLPDPSKLSKSLEDVNKLKTDNIKTIIVGSSKPLTSKNREYDAQPRVINIVTSNCGLKKGKNLMEVIGLEMETEKGMVNGGGECERRVSMESSNSESESLQKLVDGLSNDKFTEVPYFTGKSSRKEKMRLSVEKKKSEDKERKSALIEESPEDLVTKETILSALGLQSLKAAAESAQKKRDSQAHPTSYQTENGGYTGTLKTVIKIQRQEKKGNSKSPLKMVYKASSSSSSVSGQLEDSNNFDEAETTSKEETEENNSEDNKNGNGKAKSLVIPEKASSFSIHPGRLCSDVCTYCFGKFGLLDTPCHVAQLKDADKRRNILATEVHLTADSCLCDACFRHVDKKSNCPTFTDKKHDIKKRSVRKPMCAVQNCNADSQHSIKRKLFLKLKKSIGRKLVLDVGKLEKVQPGQSLTFCNRHIYWIDYFMSCGICKKRLTSVNMYRVTSEVLELNAALSSDEIPAILTENRFLCKICNCFASIRLKFKKPNEMSSSHRQFYETCRKRILKCHGMDIQDSEAEGEGKTDHKRKSKKSSKPTATVTNENSKSDNEVSMEEMEKANGNEKELNEISHMDIPPKANGNLDFGGVSITPATTEVNPTQIHVKLGNLNIGALGNLNIGQDVRQGGARGGDIQCFPTETELALRAHFEFQPSAEDESAKSARKGFEKCNTTIQFSQETKSLFYNLQMPYGNQSSFFRHLILLEKYFRSGDLVISKNADPKAVNYISSVQNRIRSYEGVHTPVKKCQDTAPGLSIVPKPKEGRCPAELKPSVIPSRPFTLIPMPANSYLKSSPLSKIQATVQNIQPPNASQGIMTSLLKSSIQTSKYVSHPKPEVSITSVTTDGPPIRLGKASVLTSKIQENLRNLASKNQVKQPNQARAVILNRTVGGQKQSLVQVTTGGKTIHLTLSQFRRIQQMQMRKKQYLEHQAKMSKGKEETKKKPEEGFNIKNLSPELEIQEVKKTNGNDVFPLISEVRSLAGDETLFTAEPETDFPKIPKTLSVSVTKIPPADYSGKEQQQQPSSVESAE